MAIKILDHYRDEFYPQTTLGYITIEEKHFCYTLEDTLRPFGIKVKGDTGIPENVHGYRVGIIYSNRFKRDVLVLYTEQDGFTLQWNGIEFSYIYAHGGNKHEDTEGCVLVAYNKNGNKIQGTAERDLFAVVGQWIKDGHEVRWRTFNRV